MGTGQSCRTLPVKNNFLCMCKQPDRSHAVDFVRLNPSQLRVFVLQGDGEAVSTQRIVTDSCNPTFNFLGIHKSDVLLAPILLPKSVIGQWRAFREDEMRDRQSCAMQSWKSYISCLHFLSQFTVITCVLWHIKKGNLHPKSDTAYNIIGWRPSWTVWNYPRLKFDFENRPSKVAAASRAQNQFQNEPCALFSPCLWMLEASPAKTVLRTKKYSTPLLWLSKLQKCTRNGANTIQLTYSQTPRRYWFASTDIQLIRSRSRVKKLFPGSPQQWYVRVRTGRSLSPHVRTIFLQQPL